MENHHFYSENSLFPWPYGLYFSHPSGPQRLGRQGGRPSGWPHAEAAAAHGALAAARHQHPPRLPRADRGRPRREQKTMERWQDEEIWGQLATHLKLK